MTHRQIGRLKDFANYFCYKTEKKNTGYEHERDGGWMKSKNGQVDVPGRPLAECTTMAMARDQRPAMLHGSNVPDPQQ